MKKKRSLPWAELSAVLSVCLLMTVVAAFTGQWPWRQNPYNSYVLQACSWLEGRLDLGRDYPWLELAIYEGKYFVSFPPFPSFVMLPFAAIWGTQVPEGWIALAGTLVGVWYAVKLYRIAGGNMRHAVFWVTFLYGGTGYLFIGMNAYVWFVAQTLCFTLSILFIYCALRGRGGWSLTFWACAVGCRPMVVLYFPLLAWVLWKKWQEQHPDQHIGHMIWKRWYWAIGPCVLAAAYMALNVLRFGNPLEFGHNYLPEFTRAEHGQFSTVYFWDNVQKLLRLPGFEAGKVSFPPADGVAFWLVNPLMVLCIAAYFWETWKKRFTPSPARVMLPLMTVGYVCVLCLHRTLGGWQFGDRYLLDVMPFLFYGLVLWMPKGERFVQLSAPLLLFAIALHVAGTVMIYQ